jgi:hypothetical protein
MVRGSTPTTHPLDEDTHRALLRELFEALGQQAVTPTERKRAEVLQEALAAALVAFDERDAAQAEVRMLRARVRKKDRAAEAARNAKHHEARRIDAATAKLTPDEVRCLACGALPGVPCYFSDATRGSGRAS